MSTHDYPLTILFDGACPMCCLEMSYLQQRNQQERLQFVDISLPEFDASIWNVSYSELMAVIHARKPDGSMVKGIDVFILSYSAIGLNWIIFPFKRPVLRPVFDWLYRYFARYRHIISAASAPLIHCIIQQRSRRALKKSQTCHTGTCTIKRRES